MEKCFCHIKDADGNIYVVKDKEARERIAALEAGESSDDSRLAAVEALAAAANSTANAATENANKAQGAADSALNGLDNKVTKKGPGSYSRVYAVNSDGAEMSVRYSTSVNSGALIQRDSEGFFKVHDPVEKTHPANMRYVDNSVSPIKTELARLKTLLDGLTGLDEAGIVALQGKVAELESEVDTLTQTHNSNVTNLEAAISAEASARAAAISAEASTREAAINSIDCHWSETFNPNKLITAIQLDNGVTHVTNASGNEIYEIVGIYTYNTVHRNNTFWFSTHLRKIDDKKVYMATFIVNVSDDGAGTEATVRLLNVSGEGNLVNKTLYPSNSTGARANKLISQYCQIGV